MENKDRDFVDINSHSSTEIVDDFESEDKMKNISSKKKSKGANIAIRITSAVLAVVFAIAGFVTFWIYKNIESFGYKSTEDKKQEQKVDDNGNPVVYQTVTTPEGEVVTRPNKEDIVYESDELLTDDYVLNIMLFGAEDQNLSDTMILLSIDNRHQKIKMTSFLRDTYVSIPGYYSHKLNLAYSLGGLYEDNAAGLSISTIEANYGIRIDRYATVNFETFKKIVDIIGGVEIEVTDDEIGYINAQIAHNGQSDYLYASAGPVVLNGQQALWYARNRGGFGFYGDDWARTDRQRKFIEAVINQVKDASLSELIEIVNNIGPNVVTNLKKTEIQALLSRALTYLNYDIEKTSMPSEGTWSYGSNHAGSVIYVNDWAGARQDLAEFIYEDALKVQ